MTTSDLPLFEFCECGPIVRRLGLDFVVMPVPAVRAVLIAATIILAWVLS